MKNLQENGILIALEGIDGSGKTTLAKNLASMLQKSGHETVLTKEPGDTPVGKTIRLIINESKEDIVPVTEFLLFSADRAQHIQQVVKPALNAGKIVISDRMADSSLAYQGYGRGLDLNFIKTVTKCVMSNVEPDLIIYLALDFSTAIKRIMSGRQHLTRFEKEEQEFYKNIINGFEQIFKERQNVLKLDASQDKETLAQKAFDNVIGLIKRKNL